MDPAHIKAIKEWPKPKSYRDIQVFLSFANFYPLTRRLWPYVIDKDMANQNLLFEPQ